MALTLACLGSPGIGFSENREGFYAGPLSAVAETIGEVHGVQEPVADEVPTKEDLKKVRGNQPFEREPIRRTK